MKKNIFLMSFYPHYSLVYKSMTSVSIVLTHFLSYRKFHRKINLIPYAVYDRFMSKNAHKISLSCLRGSFENSEISDLWISKPQ